tara:strand:+ start:1037 stop:1315 length:279 start_codon:yes stop_codon:yes gene_type:complete
MINYNRSQFFILYDLLNDILDETILMKDLLHKVKNKLNHKLFTIGKDFDLINNSILSSNNITSRTKLIQIKKSTKKLQEELASEGQIKIIFD